MARNPDAIWLPLKANATQSAIKPRAFVVHAPVDSERSTGARFREWYDSQGNETHFYIDRYGVLFQFMDTNVRADAQFDANGFAISVEVSDGRASHPEWTSTPPMNESQMVTLRRLAGWCCAVHPIPARLIDSSVGAGIGWHEQFPSWNHNGHDCPGSAREAQIVNDLIPSLSALPTAAPTPAPAAVKEVSMRSIVQPEYGTREVFTVDLSGQVVHRWYSAKGVPSPWVPVAKNIGTMIACDVNVTGVVVTVSALSAFGEEYVSFFSSLHPWSDWVRLSDLLAVYGPKA